jgi:hypothetical protein
MSDENNETWLVPNVRRSIADFLYDEEATIPRSRLLIVGSVMVVLAVLMNIQDAFAVHRSHSSHSSHKSHSSHESHSSHSNHSNHANHQNATPKPTPKPTPTATPHASHNSYVSTSRSHFSVPDAPSGISDPSLNITAPSTETIPDGVSVTVLPAESVTVTASPAPTSMPIMRLPQLPPDTPKIG